MNKVDYLDLLNIIELLEFRKIGLERCLLGITKRINESKDLIREYESQ